MFKRLTFILKLFILLGLTIAGPLVALVPWSGIPQTSGFLLIVAPPTMTFAEQTEYLDRTDVRLADSTFFHWMILGYAPENMAESFRQLQTTPFWLVLPLAYVAICNDGTQTNRVR
jgi:hypothetical protein